MGTRRVGADGSWVRQALLIAVIAGLGVVLLGASLAPCQASLAAGSTVSRRDHQHLRMPGLLVILAAWLLQLYNGWSFSGDQLGLNAHVLRSKVLSLPKGRFVQAVIGGACSVGLFREILPNMLSLMTSLSNATSTPSVLRGPGVHRTGRSSPLTWGPTSTGQKLTMHSS